MLLTGVIPKGVHGVFVKLVGGPEGYGSLSDIPEDASSIHLPPALVLQQTSLSESMTNIESMTNVENVGSWPFLVLWPSLQQMVDLTCDSCLCGDDSHSCGFVSSFVSSFLCSVCATACSLLPNVTAEQRVPALTGTSCEERKSLVWGLMLCNQNSRHEEPAKPCS